MAGLGNETNMEHFGTKPPLAAEIEINDPAKLSLLKAKFDEYQTNNRPFGTIREGEEGGKGNLSRAERITKQVVEYGSDRYPAIFKEVVLGIVLALAQTEGRDLETAPILLPEVADMVSVVTGLDVSRAKTIPFIYNEKGRAEPDLTLLVAREVQVGDSSQEKILIDESTIINFAFLEAYAAIMDYARTVTQGSTSPTSIPVVDLSEKGE